MTLKTSRENGRELEATAIIKDVAIWNQDLAEQKYYNSFFLLDNYFDDRIENLELLQ